MAEKISKQEAVRRALAHFGNDAKPAQMRPWIKAELGIEMSTDHISTAKGDILRKAGLGGRPKRSAKAPAKKAGPKATAQKAAAKAATQPAPRLTRAENQRPPRPLSRWTTSSTSRSW